jgi:hypothetical protein
MEPATLWAELKAQSLSGLADAISRVLSRDPHGLCLLRPSAYRWNVLLLAVPEEGTCEVFASVLKVKAESDAPVNIKPLFELRVLWPAHAQRRACQRVNR